MPAAGACAIGARVKRARERLGWSREELAVRSGISLSAIAQIESNRRRNLRPATLSSLAEALGVTIDYLLTGAPAGDVFEHLALVYGSDEELAASAGDYLRAGVERSEAVLAVTTAANVRLLRRRLGDAARAIEFADFAARFDAPPSVVVGFRDFARAALAAGASWIRILAGPVGWDGPAAEVRRWARLESLLNIAFASWPMTLLCPYDRRTVPARVISQVPKTHPRMLPGDGSGRKPGEIDPVRFLLEPGS